MAHIIVDFEKLHHNVKYIQQICANHHLELIGVVKGPAFLPIMNEFQELGIKRVGISKIKLAETYISHLKWRPIKLTICNQKELHLLVRYFHTSMVSEFETIARIEAEARKQQQPHNILLAVDIGDLREGVLPEEVPDMVARIMALKSKYLHLKGISGNWGCCSGVLPSHENMSILPDLAQLIESRQGVPIETISVGGTLILDWIRQYPISERINQIRIGEAILLGYDTSNHKRIEEMYSDVITITAEILEIKEKPSYPAGEIGYDAWGRKLQIVDKGIRKRAIIDIGYFDTDPTGLFAPFDHFDIITSNSDYTIVDITECEHPMRVGDEITFNINYSAMVNAFLSPYNTVHVKPANGKGCICPP